MQFLWEQFNIKTFPANTLVFVDGVFMPDLSDYDSRLFNIKTSKNTGTLDIKQVGKLPVHIMYLGKISGNLTLDITISAENVNVTMTGKIICEKPSFLKKIIKNTGKNSKFECKFLVQNKSDLQINIFAGHFAENTGISEAIKIVAHKNSSSDVSGIAEIGHDILYCDSDVSFSALCDPDIKRIKFSPIQRIGSVPAQAEHSASIWRGSTPQIQFLRHAGLSGAEVDAALKEAFEES